MKGGYQEFVKNAEYVDLSEDDIMNICMNQTKIVSYDDLPKCSDIFMLLRPYNNFILFYATDSVKLGHWVAVIWHPSTHTIELFDSYGLSDEEILGNAQTSDKYCNGYPYLTYLINKSKARFVHNTHQFQSERGNISTCGRYASLRSRFKDWDLTKFQNFLLANATRQQPPDFIVSSLTVMFSDKVM